MCHTTLAWQPSSFDHNQTRFQLTGAHQAVVCDDCHRDGQFAGTPMDCFSCHQTDFQQVTDPNHVAGNFPQDCLSCHTVAAWTPATFDHSLTRFQLTGAHQAVVCEQCHINGQFTGTPMDCFSCHQNDFQQVTDPNHVAGNFSHDCLTCHSTNAWQPATFDHSKSRFPLLGAHQAVPCAQCHVNNVYTGTPQDCFSCHQDDFQRPTDPNHLTLNFSQDCTTCHTMTAWTPATFDHDAQYFPIYSGAHKGKWQNCSTCHIDANNYKAFECINCHEHDQQRMDDKHRERPDYQYNSAACYNCHPDGRN